MIFDEIFDLTVGVYFNLVIIYMFMFGTRLSRIFLAPSLITDALGTRISRKQHRLVP